MVSLLTLQNNFSSKNAAVAEALCVSDFYYYSRLYAKRRDKDTGSGVLSTHGVVDHSQMMA